MSKGSRVFRSTESLAEEAVTRNAVGPFLAARGYQVLHDKRKQTGTAVSQFVRVRTPDGLTLQMRVRLCWRRSGERATKGKYAAAQLRARLIEGNWDDTLAAIVERDLAEGNTHHLFVQREGFEIVFAALIPREELAPIWRGQRDMSSKLIASGVFGRMTKNHAMNGTSPTIWLQDDRWPRGHEVADVLWTWPGVIDLAKIPIVLTAVEAYVDDTYDDCPVGDSSLIGSDGAERCLAVRSEVRRDPKVRREVLARTGACERAGCGREQRYRGFLDVHHILGADKGDRVWNCVALCPNCHRDAHYSADADTLNRELLHYAKRFNLAPQKD
ncbi:HNH endonuclease signature motif containing protein [Burkholderia contaminans]|uniref:HNH endonuclease signature motif containing protein n=1 Tax=Burkholderia contaminans TaxID=488447 RepID=UPI001452CD1D|nr:HNH endonuclease signature motif containing protein [Burkholderia contaminans]MCA8157755.1 HNH endonuclease [Burkholderia contaminans]VWD51538.1 HNH endonuclease [Burkholderia contaminans]